MQVRISHVLGVKSYFQFSGIGGKFRSLQLFVDRSSLVRNDHRKKEFLVSNKLSISSL